MQRMERFLWILLAAEFCVGGLVGYRWWHEPMLQTAAPPEPDLSTLHPVSRRDIADLRRKVIEHPTSDRWQELGEAFLVFGRFAEAEKCLRQAAALDPQSYRTHFWWGMAFNQLGRPADAIEQFRKAVSLAGDSPQPRFNASFNWYAIGRNWLRQENPDEAESAFRQAGDFAPAQYQLVDLLVRTNRTSEAIELADRLVRQHPNQWSAYQRRAAARDQASNASGADEDRRRVERCAEHLPDDMLIAKLQSELDRFGLPQRIAESKKLLDAGNPTAVVRRLRPLLDEEWRPDIARLLASAELRGGNFQQAIEILDVLIRSVEATPELLDQYAYAVSRLGQHSLALETWNRAAEQGDIESVHFNLANVHGTAERLDQANWHYSRAQFLVGRQLLKFNRVEESATRFQEATRLDPHFAHAWYWLGECREAMDKPVEARQAYEACLKADPNHGRATSALTRLTVKED